VLAALTAPASLCAGCGGARATPGAPVPALATTPASAEAFGQLRRRWASATRDERIALEPEVADLRAQHADEPVARVADVYLAWIALEKGDYAAARRLAAAAGAEHPGNVRDLGQLVDGATLARSGDFEGALERLTPLLGKLLDPFARELLHEESVVAAVAAHRWRETIHLLDVWLRDAPEEDQPGVLKISQAMLEQVPTASLEQALVEMRSDGNESGTMHSEPLEKAIARRLAAIALQRSDSSLARRLLAQGSALASLGEVGNDVVELASHFDVPQINGRRIGLLLPQGSTDARSRAAEASLGAMWGLELVGDGPQRASDRLVVRHDGPSPADTERALAALDAEGAAVLVGGFTSDEAQRVAEFAEKEGVAALLLVPPTRMPEKARWALALGPAEGSSLGPLVDALGERGATTIALVGASAALVSAGAARVLPSVDCMPFAPLLKARRYPLADWRKQRADAVLLAGDERCAEDVMAEAREARLPLLLGLGAAAASAALPPPAGVSPGRKPPGRLLVSTLGCFPVDSRGRPSPELTAFTARHGGPPTYWTVLGREAAVLAARAVAELPADQTLENSEVKRRRGLARAALSSTTPSPCMGLRPSPTPSPAPWRVVDVGKP
jgi:hypothetical protein